jgi:hypothetical protein
MPEVDVRGRPKRTSTVGFERKAGHAARIIRGCALDVPSSIDGRTRRCVTRRRAVLVAVQVCDGTMPGARDRAEES